MRVIGADGEMVGVLSRDEALALAEDSGMDLVEIQPNADPPVCRVMDYGKFRFELQKKAALAKKKQKVVEIKEVKFRPTTDVGDYSIKMRNVRRFLEDGDKVKITLRFRGREMAHQEIGLKQLQKIEADVLELAIKAAQAIDIAYCGVDIIRDADGKLWVLEVNSIPAWRGLQRAISVNATQMVNIAQILVDDFIGR